MVISSFMDMVSKLPGLLEWVDQWVDFYLQTPGSPFFQCFFKWLSVRIPDVSWFYLVGILDFQGFPLFLLKRVLITLDYTFLSCLDYILLSLCIPRLFRFGCRHSQCSDRAFSKESCVSASPRRLKQ